jgi:alpha-glucosidase
MPWSKGNAYAGFSEHKPWLPVGQGHADLSAAEQESDPDSVLNFTRRFLSVRASSGALRIGDVSFADVPEPLLAIRRVNGDETVLCLFNLGTDNLALPAGLAEGFACLIEAGSGEAVPAALAPHAVWIGRKV